MAKRPPKTYFETSRSLANSFLFILPLLVLYEAGMWLASSPVRNAGRLAIRLAITVPWLAASEVPTALS